MDKLFVEVEKLYSDNLEKFGNCSKAVGWNTPACHELRFDRLINELPYERSFSINDIGCGYGALLTHLKKRGYEVTQYNGYDISQPMLDEAQHELTKFNDVNLICSHQIQTVADYSLASGIFNVKCNADEEEWKKYILATLHNMHELSNIGFAFNLLTSYVDFTREDLFYADPLFYFDYCKRNFSKKVSLLHNYDLWEWTMIITK